MLRKADRVVERLSFYLSWVSAACIIVMAVLAVADVIMAKFFGGGIQVQKEIIEQCMIPVFILFAANIQLTGGLMSVDIISKHYSPAVKKAVDTIACALGTAIMSYAGWRTFALFQDYLRKQTRATTMMSSIKIWPFALCLSVGLFLLAFTYLWTILRIYFLPPEARHETGREKEGDD